LPLLLDCGHSFFPPPSLSPPEPPLFVRCGFSPPPAEEEFFWCPISDPFLLRNSFPSFFAFWCFRGGYFPSLIGKGIFRLRIPGSFHLGFFSFSPRRRVFNLFSLSIRRLLVNDECFLLSFSFFLMAFPLFVPLRDPGA